jgi:phosphoribosylformimino-5-aminoimidazole carboxamide ribonucleotide (ProFAR) isomerase
MGFEVIPAIDVAGGQLARLSSSGPVPIGAFGGDPIAAASAFIEDGAVWIHVVDVDHALAGAVIDTDLLKRISRLDVRVQASGGLSNAVEVETALEAGAERAVLSSAGLADRDGARALIEVHGEALVVGIEADGTRIVPRGAGSVELPLWDTLRWLGDLEVARFLHTEVGRTGRLRGPDLDGVWALARSTSRPVLASGGIRSLEDLRALARLDTGVEGAVVGRALYEGFDLRAARAAFA